MRRWENIGSVTAPPEEESSETSAEESSETSANEPEAESTT